MTDRLYLSLWLRGYQAPQSLPSLGRVLEHFPVSAFYRAAALRIYALEIAEPPLMERLFDDAVVDDIILAAREFENSDCGYEIDLRWDLWQRGEEWTLRHSPVRISCFGPDFENDLGEHIRIDLGPELLYLPTEDDTKNWMALRSNVRSLLRLVTELEEALPVARRTLWSDSDDDLADRLEEVIAQ